MAYGYGMEMDDRSKVDQAVRMAFVKDDSLGNLLRLNYKPAAGPLRKLRISGVFATDDTDAFIAFLRSLKGVRVEVTATGIRVSGDQA